MFFLFWKEVEVDRLHRLRKKMFWNKSSNTTTRGSNQQLNLISNDINGKAYKNSKINSFKLNDMNNNFGERLHTYRSNSLHYVNSNNRNYDFLNENSTKKSSENVASGSLSLANSTLKPFYNKLKKSHLFGVKIEKICGPYSETNCRLPNPIMVNIWIHILINMTLKLI